MYKVFVNDTPIIFTSCTKKVNNFPIYLLKNIVVEEIVYKIQQEKLRGIILFSEDLDKEWGIFLKKIKVIPAAGGLVLNAKKEVLFIYRNNVWDLPKGGIEKGESIKHAAKREVEEECGISNLKIIQPLLTTYHIYFYKGIKLKQTHWFLMSSNDTKKLVPQIEEGITEVVFKNEVKSSKATQNTYANIQLVYDAYKKVSL